VCNGWAKGANSKVEMSPPKMLTTMGGSIITMLDAQAHGMTAIWLKMENCMKNIKVFLMQQVVLQLLNWIF
jgi:hypothetical protein